MSISYPLFVRCGFPAYQWWLSSASFPRCYPHIAAWWHRTLALWSYACLWGYSPARPSRRFTSTFMWFFEWALRSNYPSATVFASTSSSNTHFYAVSIWVSWSVSSVLWQWPSELVFPINFWFASRFPIDCSSTAVSWASSSCSSSHPRELYSTLPTLTSRLPADSPKAWSCCLQTAAPLVSCCWTSQVDFLRIRKDKGRARSRDWSPSMSFRWFGTSWLWLIHIASADRSQHCSTTRWSQASASPLSISSSSPSPWFTGAGSPIFSRISP